MFPIVIIKLIMSAGNHLLLLLFFFRSSVLLPLFIYGALAFAAAVLGVWVWPETARLNLPNSMEEAERVAMTRNSWLFWKKKRKAKAEEEEEAKVEQVFEIILVWGQSNRRAGANVSLKFILILGPLEDRPFVRVYEGKSEIR